ncbi:50S ribosomal protein L17-like [Schistocerca gregaria]|uniref:50S ribosomal protein L17-like n=1 Tax=Schistocerca gregaria TaxID=7010 RepID=UPI00211EDE98|nr:50S ribosomal protein L17-like [Schistocerca gregaria]
MKITRKLSRTPAHRKMLMRVMVTNLIRAEQMRTTVAKAKEVRRHADRMVTLAKRGGIDNYRRALDFVTDRSMVQKLFSVLKPRFESRPGGYTRVLRAGNRRGDNAPMAIIEYLQPGFVSVSKRCRAPPVPPSWAGAPVRSQSDGSSCK